MNASNFQNMDVAPHGLLITAALMLLLVLFIHLSGFRIVGALRVGR